MTGPIFGRKINVKFFSYNLKFEIALSRRGWQLNKSHQNLTLQSGEKNSESKLSLYINHRQKNHIQGITSSLGSVSVSVMYYHCFHSGVIMCCFFLLMRIMFLLVVGLLFCCCCCSSSSCSRRSVLLLVLVRPRDTTGVVVVCSSSLTTVVTTATVTPLKSADEQERYGRHRPLRADMASSSSNQDCANTAASSSTAVALLLATSSTSGAIPLVVLL